MSNTYAMPKENRRPIFSSNAVSFDAISIRTKLANKNEHLSVSALDWNPSIWSSIKEIKDNYMIANWGGEEEVPIDSIVLNLFEKIICTLSELLPKFIPAPDISPEVDGDICITWQVDTKNIFSVSISKNSKINFSGHYGNRGGIHAWQALNASNATDLEKSLSEITPYIRKLYCK